MLVAMPSHPGSDLWMIWNGRLNVTLPVLEELRGTDVVPWPFRCRAVIEKAVAEANDRGIGQ